MFVVLQGVFGGGKALNRGSHAGAACRVGDRFDIQRKGALQPVAVLHLVEGDVQPVDALYQRAIFQGGQVPARCAAAVRRLLFHRLGGSGNAELARGEAALPTFRHQHVLAAFFQMQKFQLADMSRLPALVLDLFLEVQKLAQKVEVGRNGWPFFFHKSGKKGQTKQVKDLLLRPEINLECLL